MFKCRAYFTTSSANELFKTASTVTILKERAGYTFNAIPSLGSQPGIPQCSRRKHEREQQRLVENQVGRCPFFFFLPISEKIESRMGSSLMPNPPGLNEAAIYYFFAI